MNENDILGFDPSQLSVFSTAAKTTASTGNSLIYRTRPADSKDTENHIYRCVVKPMYNPHDIAHSIIEQQSYSMQDANGYFSAVSSLTVNDTNCPIFKAWKKCHFAEKGSVLNLQSEPKENGGKGLFDKRFARYMPVQILEDENQPELVGKCMFMKMPKSVWEIINSKMNPDAGSNKAAIPVMDFLFGRAIELTVKPGPGKQGDISWTRETSYLAELSEDVESCVNPDGSPLLNSSEQAVLDAYVDGMKKVWREKDATNRAALLAQVNADPNTAQLRQIYARVLETIKGFCPDINKELNYKEWTPELTARVNAWIDVVLSGNDPSKSGDVPTAAVADVASTPVFAASVTAPAPEVTAAFTAPTTSTATVEDDLPF